MPSPFTTISLFGDESGSHSSDTVVAIGMVVSSAPIRDEARLRELRLAHQCNREIKYEKTDRTILPTCEAWIRESVRTPSLQFRATLLRPRTRRRYLEHYYRQEKAVAPAEKLYNKHYCNLIQFVRRDLNVGPQVKLLTFLDAKEKPVADNFAQYLRKEIPSIVDLQFVDSKRHQLIQLADLFNGCLRSEFVGRVTNEAKREKIGMLLDALGVRRFGHLNPGSKFRFDMF